MTHSVLLVLDSLQARAIERLGLENLQALAAEGAWFSACETLAPYFPGAGLWRRYKTATISNPVMMTGTILPADDSELLSEAFARAGRTAAHASNAGDLTVNRAYRWSFVDSTAQADNETTIAWAQRFLREARPDFLRVHLQDLGKDARRCYVEPAGAPWAHNIWGEGSPYIATARRVDDIVGRFIRFLKSGGFWDDTHLFVAADHGMSVEGRHTWWEPDAAQTPLIIAGPGVRKGARFDYAESVDIAPTLCRLAGIEPPRDARGVALTEALEDGGDPAPRPVPLRRINELLYDYDVLFTRAYAAALGNPFARNRLEVLDNAWMGLRRFCEWSDFKDTAALFEHNRRIHEQVAQLAQELGAA